MAILLPVTLTSAAAAAILNFWLALRVGQLRVRLKVLHGDDGGPLMQRMRAHANFIEYTPIVLILIAAIEMTGKGAPWLAWVAAAYMLARIAHAFGMDSATGSKWRAVGIVITMLVMLGLAVAGTLIVLGVI